MRFERNSENYLRFAKGLEERGAKLTFWKLRDAGRAEEAVDMRILLPGEKSRRVVRVSTRGRAEEEVYGLAFREVFPDSPSDEYVEAEEDDGA